jgi:hypothetical protein
MVDEMWMKKTACWLLFMVIHLPTNVKVHLTLAFCKVLYGVSCMKIKCTPIIYSLYKGYGQGTVPVCNFIAGYCTESWMNLTLCAQYCGQMRQDLLEVANLQSLHELALENPHATWQSTFQHRCTVNVWASVINKYWIGFYIIEEHIGRDQYTQFLEATLPLLLEDVHLDIRARMWFQHDGAPPHFTWQVRNFLDINHPKRWIGQGESSVLASTRPGSNTPRLFFVELS